MFESRRPVQKKKATLLTNTEAKKPKPNQAPLSLDNVAINQLAISEEMIVRIFSYLSPEQRMNAALTCRSFNLLANDNLLWKADCLSDEIDISTVGDDADYKKLFVDHLSKSYFLIGERINLYTPGHFSGGRYKTKLTKEEVLSLFPSEGKAVLYTSKKDAEDALAEMDRFRGITAFSVSNALFEIKLTHLLPLKKSTHTIFGRDTASHQVPCRRIDAAKLTGNVEIIRASVKDKKFEFISEQSNYQKAMELFSSQKK